MTVKDPTMEPEIVRLAVPDVAIDEGTRLVVRLASDPTAFKFTFPLKPFEAVIVMVDWPDPPTTNARLVGFADMPKSGETTLKTTTVV